MTRIHRMIRAAVPVAAILFLVACGDDDPANTGGSERDAGVEDSSRSRTDDVGSGTEDTADLVEDVAQETVEDVAEEIAEDIPQEPAVESICDDNEDNDGDGLRDCADPDCEDQCEICTDLIDNDGDVLIDCDDPDCSRDESCPELCGNGVDDDADFTTDCDDDECNDQPRCYETPTPVNEYEFSDQLGWFYQILYPPSAAPCCDFDDDGEPDLANNLLLVLGVIPDYDEQLNLNAVINDGELAIFVEWTEFPEDLELGGPAEFNLYRAHPTSPAPPFRPSGVMGDNDWADGNGLFKITRDSFDARGPRVRLRDGQVTDGVFLGGPSTVDVTIPIDELGIDLSTTIYDAWIRMHLTTVDRDIGPDEVRTVPQTIDTSGGPVIVPGGEVGGIVRAADVMQLFNEAADECGCATPFGEARPLIDYGERINFGRASFSAACQWTPLSTSDASYSCTLSDSSMCPRMAQLCALVPGLPLFLDIDTNKNEANDAFSVGLYFDVVGANLDIPAVDF